MLSDKGATTLFRVDAPTKAWIYSDRDLENTAISRIRQRWKDDADLDETRHSRD